VAARPVRDPRLWQEAQDFRLPS